MAMILSNQGMAFYRICQVKQNHMLFIKKTSLEWLLSISGTFVEKLPVLLGVARMLDPLI
jgi:hypothetical protein